MPAAPPYHFPIARASVLFAISSKLSPCAIFLKFVCASRAQPAGCRAMTRRGPARAPYFIKCIATRRCASDKIAEIVFLLSFASNLRSRIFAFVARRVLCDARTCRPHNSVRFLFLSVLERYQVSVCFVFAFVVLSLEPDFKKFFVIKRRIFPWSCLQTCSTQRFVAVFLELPSCCSIVFFF